MTDQNATKSWVKTGLEFGPIILFFVFYLKLKDRSFDLFGTSYEGFIVVTAGFVPLLLLSYGLLWRLTGKLSRMQIVTLVLVIVFGGLSVWFNDERYFKMKPTLIYAIFGGVLAFGLLRGQSYLRLVMEDVMPLRDAGWMILTRRLMWCFFGMALLNELVWRLLSTQAWVYFKTFGLTAAIFLFFVSQFRLFQTYGEPD
jgi:intracellular septation protein